MRLYTDCETFAAVNLGACGVYKYVNDTSFELLLLSYAIDGGSVHVWDTFANPTMPEPLAAAFRDAHEIYAHNSSFDRVVFEALGFVGANDTRWRDTMIRAYAHGLPGALAILSEIYRLGDKGKDQEGKRLLNKFSKLQRNGQRIMPGEDPQDWEKFKHYAEYDTVAMRELDRLIPRWNDTPDERRLWAMDRAINDRGIPVDTHLALNAVAALSKAAKRAGDEVTTLTGGAVDSTSQVAALRAHLLDTYGVKLPNLQKSTVERRLNDPELPEAVKDILRARLSGSGTATAKYNTLVSAASPDKRLRGALQFCGAPRTGRWSGRRFQPQNLPRPTHGQHEIDAMVQALLIGFEDYLTDDIKGLCSSCIRSAIKAPEGKRFIQADLSAIEGRALAWLSGETWKIDAYAHYDKHGGADLYERTYAKTFGIRPEDVTKAQRQLGKVLELALGYAGGVGAFVMFANTYGIDLETMGAEAYDTLPPIYLQAAHSYYTHAKAEGRTSGLSERAFVVCDAVKRMWRDANPRIVQLWADLDTAARVAIASGRASTVGRLQVDKKGAWLRVKLPSGRFVCYPSARIDAGGNITYMGMDTYTRKWSRLKTYGGKLAENMTQAASRDVLAYGGMLPAEAAGYTIVLTVHDEILAEVPTESAHTVRGLCDIMSAPLAWAADLPLAAEGYESNRYRK